MEARQLVAELIKEGLTQTEIAKKTDIPQPTISKVARGAVKDLLSRKYLKLQALHAEITASSNAQAPDASDPQEA